MVYKKKNIVDDISDETIVVVSEDEIEADLNAEKLNALKKQMESRQKKINLILYNFRTNVLYMIFIF